MLTAEETARIQNSCCVTPGKRATPALGHHVFDQVTQSWKRGSPNPHPAERVKVEIDRSSYRNRGRTKEMWTPVNAWSFPDSGAQVVMIPPNMVEAMGGNSLVFWATLQITDAGGHKLPVDGAIFITITRVDSSTGSVKRSRQMAYLCTSTRNLVLPEKRLWIWGW